MSWPSDHFMPSRTLIVTTRPSSLTSKLSAMYGMNASESGPCWINVVASALSTTSFSSALISGLNVRGSEIAYERYVPPNSASPGSAAVQALGQTNGCAAAIDTTASAARDRRTLFMLPPQVFVADRSAAQPNAEPGPDAAYGVRRRGPEPTPDRIAPQRC